MAHEWHKDPNKVIELAEFMVEAEQIHSAKDLLDYFKYPDKYTEVWNLYQEEIIGKPPISHKYAPKTPIPVMLALTGHT